MTQPQSAFRRAPRPLTGWLYLACGVGSIVVIAAIVIPVIRAVNRWADGDAVDWMGFAAIAGVICPFVIQLIVQGAQWMNQRHTERLEEYARGVAPVPFAPSQPPTPDGGLVNNESIE